jgi:tetratricopeptide (TPR) repeat protein
MDASLWDRLAEAERNLNADSAQATLDLCQTVLGRYPRCLRACRLVAECLWAKGDTAGAIQLHRAVLQADPEDLIARYGLAMALEEEGLDEAIRELEIAFSLAPSDPEVRQALQRLYQQRDKGPLRPLEMGGDALARLYAKGRLWPRVLVETTHLLLAQPRRLDLRVLHAEALWRTAAFAEAAGCCQDILQVYPHCLKPSLILGDILQQRGAGETAQEWFRKAQELDPENTVAIELFGQEEAKRRIGE